MERTGNKIKHYWDQFYTKQRLGIENIPSQFAAFVLAEFPRRNLFIDIGCGNGRDTFFFAQHVRKVIGLDGSDVAINLCMEKNKNYLMDNIHFRKLDLSQRESCRKFLDQHSSELNGAVIYARFLLHAIDDEAEKNFLTIARSVSAKEGVIAVEFRTHRDERQRKETSKHYRRYINPLDFMAMGRSHKMDLAYFTEGFGFAKYKSDDAHVARFIFQSANSG